MLQARAAELQHRRHLVHQEAEAAIKQAAAQQELNAGQYDHAGRALVHVKVLQPALGRWWCCKPALCMSR